MSIPFSKVQPMRALRSRHFEGLKYTFKKKKKPHLFKVDGCHMGHSSTSFFRIITQTIGPDLISTKEEKKSLSDENSFTLEGFCSPMRIPNRSSLPKTLNMVLISKSLLYRSGIQNVALPRIESGR